MSKRITELPNELSHELDVCSTHQFIDVLRRVDDQIFSGWGSEYRGIQDAGFCDKLVVLSERVKKAVTSGGRVIFSGAGTSGRLACFCAGSYNGTLESAGRCPAFRYLIAGGFPALVRAQEGAEDDPLQAVKDLQKCVEGATGPIVYVGITCGLSAPYVAAQALYALSERSRVFPIILGFTPPETARNAPVENWSRTVRSVVRDMQAAEHAGRACVLSPVVGPEAITGSSRMKGGSATKIVLDALCLPAVSNELVAAPGNPTTLFAAFRAAVEALYEHKELEIIIQAATDSLCAGGRLLYLGAPPLGVLGIIDAAECPPTFGASFADVQGFVAGGWGFATSGATEVDALHNIGMDVSLDDFEQHVLATLSTFDCVIFLSANPEICDSAVSGRLRHILASCKASSACVFDVSFVKASDKAAMPPANGRKEMCIRVSGDWPFSPELPRVVTELVCKLALNAISTGAHVGRGKVFRNRMVDLRISNDKLFHRALDLLRHFACVEAGRHTTEREARGSLLRVIYDKEVVEDRETANSTPEHIRVALTRCRVVPTALVLVCRPDLSLAEAKRWIAADPVVRRCLSGLTSAVS